MLLVAYTRNGMALPVRAELCVASMWANSPHAQAARYVDMRGVGANLVATHSPSALDAVKDEASVEPGTYESLNTVLRAIASGANGLLPVAFMFARTVSCARAIIVILKVALKRGSSQQGKARRAPVGSHCVSA